jgi:hypothetical protein
MSKFVSFMFSDDRNTFTGRWEWPGGGFEATMTRVKSYMWSACKVSR